MDSGLVFEDDAQINPEVFAQALQVAFNNIRSNVIIRFKYNEPKVIESLFGTYSNKIYFPLIPSPVLVSYLISNSTAKKLLAMTEKFNEAQIEVQNKQQELARIKEDIQELEQKFEATQDMIE